MKGSKVLATLMLSAMLFTGCATTELQTNAKMTQSIFINPVKKELRTVFLSSKNTSGQKINLENTIIAELQAKGYQVIDDPEAATYVLMVNVLYCDKKQENNAGGGALGAGAIGAVVTAMISDVVKEEQRSKAMAIMGGFIGISFALAMGLGPVIGGYAGVPALFYITMILSLIAIFILVKKVPNPPKITHTYNDKLRIKDVLGNANINKMHITNFLQKALMTFAFLVIPIILTKTYSWEIKDLWQVYIPSMVLGLLAMGPASILAEKKGKYREVLVIGILLFIISYLLMGFSSSSIIFCIGVVLFFIGFNMHEPIMQSLTSKFAKVHQRGSVLGVFNSFGYLGTFVGGVFGGILLDKLDSYEIESFTLAVALICILWAILIILMKNPSKTKNLYLSLDEYKLENSGKLNDNSNIDEWYINNTENILVVKYSQDKISEDDIKSILK